MLILNSVGLPSLHAEYPTTKKVIAAIPADKADYRPDSISRSALDLAWHIVTAENRFLEAVLSGAFDLTPRPRPDTVLSPADVNSWYEERFATSIARLKGLSGDQLLKTIDFRGVFRLPAVSFIQIALNHSIHHRGQLTMYLRPLDAKVPSIYGESYDARMAREALRT
ncbi:MAG TPA: DinB family protein [Vicinamibacteria bacterium]|nr:DinB family protein [Vicinamibacteria bacterium]